MFAVYARTTKDGTDHIEMYERKQDRNFVETMDQMSKNYGHKMHKAQVFESEENLREWVKKELGANWITLLDKTIEDQKKDHRLKGNIGDAPPKTAAEAKKDNGQSAQK
ncbi:hypothetical protein EVB95_047 [Rhizobium phage RHph_TM2_3B]|nr:hypothetical protein EVB95_047 [Rhizobium phage RHph_TM2_3B]